MSVCYGFQRLLRIKLHACVLAERGVALAVSWTGMTGNDWFQGPPHEFAEAVCCAKFCFRRFIPADFRGGVAYRTKTIEY